MGAKDATRCAVYLRISLDRNGDGLAVDRQRADCQRIAAERGWTIVGEYVDKVTASDRRKARPGYDALVKAYAAGTFDAMVCWDLDRLTRQPRQLEDWIDAAEDRGLVLVTANGEADLSTDNGRLFARIKASVARAEIERKATRQRSAAAQRADKGRPPLGVRLTGYTPKGEVIEAEAVVVRQVFERFAAGDSLRGITSWLAETGVPTRHGGPWNPSSVRSILVNPRYAGRAIYNGQETGKAGGWPPLVDGGLFEAVAAKLADPRRKTQHGTHRKYLGSGLYRCGVCDRLVRSHSGGGTARYRCPAGGHITRLGASIDAHVLRVLRLRLGRPDLAELLPGPADDKDRAIRAEVRRLRGRLDRIEADYDAGLIDGRRYKVASDKVRTELAAAEAAHGRLMSDAGVAATINAPDPVAAFDAAPLGTRRAVVDALMVVRLDPAQRGHKFDPETVRVEWKS